MSFLKQIRAVFGTLLLLIWSYQGTMLWSQTPPSGGNGDPSRLSNPLRRLRVYNLSGNNNTNRIREGLIVTPVVEVRDANDLPIEGATVNFRLPASGPGGTFPGGAYTKQVRTDAQGQAIADGFQPNGQDGRFTIQVRADYEGVQAVTTIEQVNSSLFAADVDRLKKSKKKRRLLWVGVAAGAGVAAAIILSGRSGSSTPQVGVSTGPVVVGGR